MKTDINQKSKLFMCPQKQPLRMLSKALSAFTAGQGDIFGLHQFKLKLFGCDRKVSCEISKIL